MLSLFSLIILFTAHVIAHPFSGKSSNTTNSSYAYTVAIYQPGLAEYSQPFICSGVLISPNKVLTIVECVQGLGPHDISIRTGTSDANYKNVSVASITAHTGYSIDTLANDIAIISLTQNSSITPAIISNHCVGVNVTTISWGPPTNEIQGMATTPTVAPEGVLNSTLCAERLHPCFASMNTSQHFCTETKTGFESYGSGGGPVVDPSTGMLVGLISGNPTCAAPNNVSLQVNLEVFRDWIANTIGLMG